MLTADDLAGMRETLEDSLSSTCQVVRYTLTDNGHGGQSSARAVVAADVPCRIAPLTETVRLAEIQAEERLAARAPWIATLPAGTTLDEECLIENDSLEYEVAAVFGQRSDEISCRVLVRRYNGGHG